MNCVEQKSPLPRGILEREIKNKLALLWGQEHCFLPQNYKNKVYFLKNNYAKKWKSDS